MNTIEQYRDKKASELASSKAGRHDGDFENGIVIGTESGYQEGFDAAIELDLPVKFAEWLMDEIIDRNPIEKKWVVVDEMDDKTSKELYEYWIKNVYKPE